MTGLEIFSNSYLAVQTSPEVFWFLLFLAIIASWVFRAFANRENRERITQSMIDQGNSILKINWAPVALGSSMIQGRCYEVIYQTSDGKTEKKYCYCARHEPLVWVEPTDGY